MDFDGWVQRSQVSVMGMAVEVVFLDMAKKVAFLNLIVMGFCGIHLLLYIAGPQPPSLHES